MADLPRLLLLGDSIRVSYQPLVAAALAGKAQVVGPKENCRFALYSLMRLPTWLEELGKPDVVHWNNGLWDCGHNPFRGPRQFSCPDYLTNLKHILEGLRATGARIVWATITPVHPDRPFSDAGWAWRNEEIDAYNAAASAFMQSQGVPINDLGALVRAEYQALLAADMLHLCPTGQEKCAQAVVQAVTPLLQPAAVVTAR